MNLLFTKPISEMTDKEIALVVRINDGIEQKIIHQKQLNESSILLREAEVHLAAMQNEFETLCYLIDPLTKFINDNPVVKDASLYFDNYGHLNLEDFLNEAISIKEKMPREICSKNIEINDLKKLIKKLEGLVNGKQK